MSAPLFVFFFIFIFSPVGKKDSGRDKEPPRQRRCAYFGLAEKTS
jgi:hypothetical protein